MVYFFCCMGRPAAGQQEIQKIWRAGQTVCQIYKDAIDTVRDHSDDLIDRYR